jgi:hypothetical protein
MVFGEPGLLAKTGHRDKKDSGSGVDWTLIDR